MLRLFIQGAHSAENNDPVAERFAAVKECILTTTSTQALTSVLIGSGYTESTVSMKYASSRYPLNENQKLERV